ncbi:DUF429 domain-containing protein [Paenibacillus thalictri]|uniref:DUF429 domain-containing protein n=1 Tax=Paenibacillus thalictri TaxID=2527873 RepID=UPI0013EEF701|nr:DUF429 domain-containing protein [Paenibacillus thalictri]
MIIFGVDCATETKNIGFSIYDYSRKAFVGCRKEASIEETILHYIERFGGQQILLCFDAPLGWPDDFAPVLYRHMAGDYLGNTPDAFFKRDTDIFCAYLLRKIPLEIASDKIARTAYKTLQIIESIRTSYPHIQIRWDPAERVQLGFIEVYPAAWLLSELISPNISRDKKTISYKGTKPENKRRRMEIIREMRKKGIRFTGFYKKMIEEEHFFDACLCCLCGKDFLDQRAIRPFPDLTSVFKEGWIWMKPTI